MMARWSKQKLDQERHTGTVGGGAPVYSYRSNRLRTEAATGRHETQRQPRHPAKWLQNAPSYLVLASILGCLFYASTLTSHPTFIVNGSQQSNILLRNSAEYEQAADKILRSSPLNYNKLTLNTAGVAVALQKEFPELSNVAVSIPLINHQLLITAEVGEPVLILATQAEQYVINESGHALVPITKVPDQSKLRLPVVTDLSTVPIKSGQLALTSETVEFIRIISGQLQEKGVDISSYTLPTTPEELDVGIAGQAYLLRFNLTSDARQQSGAYLALKQKLDADKVVPKEYVDLRVEERAYYK